MRLVLRIRVLAAAILAVAAIPCLADEVAVLKNGFSVRHERRVVVGDVTRLYVTADGASFVDVPTAEIEHFEAAPAVPAASLVPTSFLASTQRSKSPPFDKLRASFLAKDTRNGAPVASVFPPGATFTRSNP